MRGRPLWFLGLVVAGWAAARVVALSPDDWAVSGAQTLLAGAPAADAHVPTRIVFAPTAGRTGERAATAGRGPAGRPDRRVRRFATADRVEGAAAASAVTFIYRPPAPGRDRQVVSPREVPPPPGLPVPASVAGRTRWSGSAWAIVRAGGGSALLSPLLGGSQAGARLVYALDRAGRLAVFARAATPLGDGAAELALGGQWRPGRAPVTLFAEARSTRGRIAPAAGVFGGGTAALGTFRLDGYAQAGAIGRQGLTGFGDGQVRLIRPLGRVQAGVGLWGAAQRGASRLDAGPSVSVPIGARPLALRLTLDWRHRIAGNARPATGPVLSLGADF